MRKKEKQHVCLQKQKLKADVVEGQEAVLVSQNAGFPVVQAAGRDQVVAEDNANTLAGNIYLKLLRGAV